VKQQRLLKRVAKDYVPPTDPNWHAQWSLVSKKLERIFSSAFRKSWNKNQYEIYAHSVP